MGISSLLLLTINLSNASQLPPLYCSYYIYKVPATHLFSSLYLQNRTYHALALFVLVHIMAIGLQFEPSKLMYHYLN